MHWRVLRSKQITRRHRKALPVPPPIDYGQSYFGTKACELARDLLWEHLTDQQREQYIASREFTAKGGKSGREYVVRAGLCHIPGQRYQFCLHVGDDEPIPYEDQILAKKLLIELAEDKFLAVANRNSY